jgi:hypothetical protein
LDLRRLRRLRTAREIDLSEQFAYWNAKRRDQYPDEAGTFVWAALEGAAADGICLEQEWLYNPLPVPGNEGQGPPAAGSESAASSRRASGISLLDAKSSAAIRAVVHDGRPVAISIPVYKNWHQNPTVRLYGTIPMPLPGSRNTGGHAMCVAGFGYADDFSGGGYFVVRNSWGAQEWASQSRIAPGYGALPFEYIDRYGWEAFAASG